MTNERSNIPNPLKILNPSNTSLNGSVIKENRIRDNEIQHRIGRVKDRKLIQNRNINLKTRVMFLNSLDRSVL